jgi:hypothetical protein
MIRHWWYAGEESLVRKYDNKFRNSAEVLAAAGILVALWFVLPQRDLIVVKALALIQIPWLIAERRLAIIFTPTEVIYRPALGSPRSIKFEYIVKIEKTHVPRTIAGSFSGWDRGVALRILGGEVVTWTLRFSDPDDVLQQLSRMTGKPVK